MKTLLKAYTNGNTSVEIYNDGTRVLDYPGTLELDFPLQVDLKITNHCDLSEYCQWCHEGSNKQGAHGDLDKALSVVAGMPKGSELAIGGGNPLDHPGLTNFLIKARSLGLIPNMTVNELHLKRYKSQLEELIERKLIFGLGISYSGKQKKLIKHFVDLNPNTVIHVIAGIQDINCLKELRGICDKVLVLGYKRFGKGEDFYSSSKDVEIDAKIQRWNMLLPKYFGKYTISFDNRAIEQLKVKRYFTNLSWRKFYQGDEGTISFYIDAVKEEYGINSTANDRYPFSNDSIYEMFSRIKKDGLFLSVVSENRDFLRGVAERMEASQVK